MYYSTAYTLRFFYGLLKYLLEFSYVVIYFVKRIFFYWSYETPRYVIYPLIIIGGGFN